MAGLTPEEQAFFESGGDVSKLNLPAPGVQGVDPLAPSNTPPTPAYTALDTAGLGNNDPAPATPVATPAPVAAPAATPAPVAVDQTELIRQALAESNRQMAEIKAQLEAQRKPPEPEVKAPDPTTDPLGNMLHQLDNVNKQIAAMKAELTNEQNNRSQLETFNRFQQQVQQLRNEFQVTQTDFPEAYKHLRDARVADLKAYGMADPEINRTLLQEEIALSQAAIQRGQNPAQAIYEMAKRHGYTRIQTPAPTSAPKPTDLAAVKRGVESAPPDLPRTPNGVDEITVEALREASDADLNKLVTDPAAWAKIAGTNTHPI